MTILQFLELLLAIFLIGFISDSMLLGMQTPDTFIVIISAFVLLSSAFVFVKYLIMFYHRVKSYNQKKEKKK